MKEWGGTGVYVRSELSAEGCGFAPHFDSVRQPDVCADHTCSAVDRHLTSRFSSSTSSQLMDCWKKTTKILAIDLKNLPLRANQVQTKVKLLSTEASNSTWRSNDSTKWLLEPKKAGQKSPCQNMTEIHFVCVCVCLCVCATAKVNSPTIQLRQ